MSESTMLDDVAAIVLMFVAVALWVRAMEASR
jgi:hypothetical protein